ncbi:DNA cytosine methyltransferase [Clostridium sartagoforme]|uniref:DNA cytosine methyltransferase n=1 Tax=Clostridium sartagoforme TaxID=84031 RepID=UPI0031D4DA2B
MEQPIVLDIFCGAGGMSEGFIQAGFDVKFATDINETAQLTYMNRHNQLGYETKFICEDIRKFSKKSNLKKFLEGTEIDVVCGGPPCQGFSLAGKRDKNDPRNMLFSNYIRVIRNVKPKYFVMENVEGILSMKFDKFKGVKNKIYENKTVAEILKDEFFQIGYYVEYRVLQAIDFGVPQTRRRVFFLGHKIRRVKGGKYKDLVEPPTFPNGNNANIVTIKDAINDLSFLESGHKSIRYREDIELTEYQKQSIEGRTPNKDGKMIRSNQLFNHEASKHSEKVKKRFALIDQGEDIICLRNKLDNEDWEVYETKKTRCKRAIENKPAPTVLTLPDDLIHYSKNRIMTVREFARLQSFDDSFEFLGKRTTGGDRRKSDLPQYTQVGNAVPPLLAKAVANEIMNALKK